MKKFSGFILGLGVILNLVILVKIIQEIIPNYVRSDWLMVMWAVLPLLYFGFFFVGMFNEKFSKKFGRTIKILTIGLLLSLVGYLIPQIIYYFSMETDPLGFALLSMMFGLGLISLTFVVSVIFWILDLVRK
jgi:hypothetical protein